MSDKPLDGKVAIVTGAGSPIGFGRAMSLALAEAGARVAMMDVNGEWLGQSVRDVKAVGGPECSIEIVGDVSRPEDVQRAVKRTVAALGGVDVLVNNAGISPRHTGLVRPDQTKFWQISAEAWFKVAGVNYFGPVLMAQACVPYMLEKGWGRIIGVTTSLDTMWRQSTYGSTKAGHEAFVASIALELNGTGVTANVLTPGGPANTNLLPQDTPMDSCGADPTGGHAEAGCLAGVGRLQGLERPPNDCLLLG